jgi:Cu-Zn family superoxide dismutase
MLSSSSLIDIKEPKMRTYLVPMMLLTLTGCSTVNTVETAAVSQVSLAKLTRADGSEVGAATLSQSSDGLLLTVAATGLMPGSYGIHLHAVGKCEAPDFGSAGAHWNPGQKQHGFENPMGAHRGDLRNLVANAEGSSAFNAKLGAVPFSGEGGAIDADGLAIVIHEKPDDYATDPSGNSGKRIICGVFGQD